MRYLFCLIFSGLLLMSSVFSSAAVSSDKTSAKVMPKAAPTMSEKTSVKTEVMSVHKKTEHISPEAMLEEMNKIRYIQSKGQEESIAALVAKAKESVMGDPSPTNRTVYAAILAFQGHQKGGLSGLSLAKESYRILSGVISSGEPDVLDGYAYTTLAALYLNVPSWPIGFGDKKKAKEFIDKAIAKDSANIDANFYLASYYLMVRDKAAARQTLENVVKMPVRASHKIGDEGRKKEAEKLLASL